MSDQENVRAVLEAAASHPKVATAVAGATTAMGWASMLSMTQTILGSISLFIGCLVGFYVLRINMKKEKIYERMLQNGESLKE